MFSYVLYNLWSTEEIKQNINYNDSVMAISDKVVTHSKRQSDFYDIAILFRMKFLKLHALYLTNTIIFVHQNTLFDMKLSIVLKLVWVTYWWILCQARLRSTHFYWSSGANVRWMILTTDVRLEPKVWEFACIIYIRIGSRLVLSNF